MPSPMPELTPTQTRAALALRRDPKRPNTEIARLIGTGPTTVFWVRHWLEDAGILTAWRPRPEPGVIRALRPAGPAASDTSIARQARCSRSAVTKTRMKMTGAREIHAYLGGQHRRDCWCEQDAAMASVPVPVAAPAAVTSPAGSASVTSPARCLTSVR